MITFFRKVFQSITKYSLISQKSTLDPPFQPSSEMAEFASLLSFNPPPLFLTAGMHQGEYGSIVPAVRGSEFYDLAPYYRGDYSKDLDWKIYFKTGELVKRRYGAAQGALLIFYLDATGSMRFSLRNGHSKVNWAKAMMFLLTQAALKGGHSVVWKVESQGQLTSFPPLTSIQQAFALFNDLQKLEAKGSPVSFSSSSVDSSSHSTLTIDSKINPHIKSLFRKKTHMVIFSDFLREDCALFQEWTSFQPAYQWIWVCLHAQDDLMPPLNHSFIDPETLNSGSKRSLLHQGPRTVHEQSILRKDIKNHLLYWKKEVQKLTASSWVDWGEEDTHLTLSKNFDQLYQILSNRSIL